MSLCQPFLRSLVFLMIVGAGSLYGCGGGSPNAEGAAPDVGDDAPAADTEGDSGSDVALDGTDDTDPADTDLADTDPADTDPADTDPADTDADTQPPRIPLADFVPCEQDLDCPNGTGNCITTLSFSRETAGTPATLAVRDIDPDWPAAGVCSLDCGTSPEACANLSFGLVPPNIETPYTCMLVAVGEAPYPEGVGLPAPESLDPVEQTLGVPFAALCVPPLHEMEAWPADFGQPCSAASPCSDGSACWLDEPFAEDTSDNDAGVCLAACAEGDTCPVGFACVAFTDGNPESEDGRLTSGLSGRHCLPLERTFSSCRDADGDGFGAGQCDGVLSTPHDCDDQLPYVRFEDASVDGRFPAFCGETFDVNCNGVPDADEQLGTSSVEGDGFGYAHCTSCGIGCAGEVPNGQRACGGGAAAPTCGVRCATDEGGTPTHADCDGDVDTGCEVAIEDPARLFLPDCDGDGVGNDELPTFWCDDSPSFDRDGVACAAVSAFTNTGTGDAPVWEAAPRDCDDADGTRYPGNAEACDTVDNDCDGTPDNPPRLDEVDISCEAEALGECARGTLACRPELSPELTCVAGLPGDELCDGLDNDCDPSTEDGADEIDVGATCTDPSGEGVGACGFGAISCSEGELLCLLNTPTLEIDWPEDSLPDTAPSDPINDLDCDGFPGDLDRAIFVGGFGPSDSNPGSISAPVATFERVLELQSAEPARVQVYFSGAGPVAAEPVSLPNTVGWYGGYVVSEGDVWQPSVAKTTLQVTLDASTATATTPWTAAISVGAAEDVRLRNIHVEIDSVGEDVVNVAVFDCSGAHPERDDAEDTSCGNVSLQDVDLSVSRGAELLAGDNGWGAPSSLRLPFTYATVEETSSIFADCAEAGGLANQDCYGQVEALGRTGGFALCATATPQVGAVVVPGVLSGGPGYRGGQRATLPDMDLFGGVWTFETGVLSTNTTYYIVIDRLREALLNDYRTPPHYLLYSENTQGEGPGGGVQLGQAGAPGGDAPDLDGLPSDPGGGSSDAWAPADGAPGENGADGAPGSGGAAGVWESLDSLYEAPDTSFRRLTISHGAAGGGGGYGGCGGSGGYGGRAGGTVAGLVVTGAAMPVFTRVNVDIAAGNGGDGGAGHPGTDGGDGFSAPGPATIPDDETGLESKVVWSGLVIGSAAWDVDTAPLAGREAAERGAGGRGGGGAPGSGGGGGQGGSAIGIYHLHGTTVGADGDGLSVTVTPGLGGAGGAGGSRLTGTPARQSPAGYAGPAGSAWEQLSRGSE